MFIFLIHTYINETENLKSSVGANRVEQNFILIENND